MYHANFSKTKKYNYAYKHFYICKKNVSDIHVLKGSFCIVYFKLYLNSIHLKIAQLDKKMEDLKAEKHDLFSQLKKVLHQEDETRKKAQLKEQRYEFNAFSTGSSCLKR